MRFFCSQQSQANGETLFGTVAQIRSWLLIEYPGVWRHDAIADSPLFSPEVKAHLRRAADRALLIRQDHASRCPLRTFLVDSCSRPPAIRQGEVEDYSQLPGQIAYMRSAASSTGLMFAVCTHARHDKCCAKFGNPVWCALRDLRPQNAWQCSHVGGDRFAANVVVLPYGIYYGRVTPETLPELVQRSEAGEVWLPGYRGRSCYPRTVQVAEHFLRRETGETRIDAYRQVTVSRKAAPRTEVVFESLVDGSRYLVGFTAHESAFRQRLTCETEDESPVQQYELTSCARVD